jgi:hypothetical protein
MVATQVTASTASALAPQPMDAKMVTVPSASESATAIASTSEALATPVSDTSLIASPDEKRVAHETDAVASADRDITEELTTGADRDITDKHNATEEADTVINTESSTATEVAKEPPATALPNSEDAEQSNQDLQEDETSMEQSQAAKACSFPSVAG